jgi:glycosyltransferase involved in cell wall biosynthesis
MRISVNIITQNRARSLQRLLRSLEAAHYVGDEVPLSFNMDSRVDDETLATVAAFGWRHGPVAVRRRVIPGGLVRAVTESWYPATDDDYGLLLEDDIEVSPFYYMWVKYALLAYRYDPAAAAAAGIAEQLSAVALYTPKLIEVVKERPKWNATDFFKGVNTPYLHQLPCSWGSLFFPKHWREFYKYMGSRFTDDAKANPVQIPRSRTNGWQASWKKFLIDMMYLRGYVVLYPNFPGQASFSTNHMEPGAHINASGNVLKHNKEDFEVPLLADDDEKRFWDLLPGGRMPPPARLPVLDLFNHPSSLHGLRSAGSRLKQDVLECDDGEVVAAHPVTGSPIGCTRFK